MREAVIKFRVLYSLQLINRMRKMEKLPQIMTCPLSLDQQGIEVAWTNPSECIGDKLTYRKLF
jgi:hypothetical protein